MKITRLPGGVGSVKLNTDLAEGVIEEMSAKLVTRVGILGAKTNRSTATRGSSGKARITKNETMAEQTNAEIGLLHEKGSFSRHIPRRSFLEMPLITRAQELQKTGEALKAWLKRSVDGGLNEERGWRKIHKDLGIKAEAIIQKAFATRGFGDWAPNSNRTKDLKGSDSPLIDTAQLRRSITSQVISK